MDEKIVQTAGRQALGEFAPMFAHLNDDVLFGEVWNETAISHKTKCIVTWAVFRLAKDVWNESAPAQTELEKYAATIFFPVGKPNDAYAKYFTGKSYLAPVSTEQVPVFNVTFEPGCRNNWHVHHATSGGGQMLICVGGRGWYQEWGKPAVAMTPGTVVNIPANVKHWHGAAADSWFSHLAVEVKGENAGNEWLEPVSDADYAKLK